MIKIRFFSTALALTLLVGCSTYEERLAEVRVAYGQGRFQECDERLRELAEDDSDNGHLYTLERAVVQLAMGNSKDAENLLLQGMREMDRVETNGFRQWGQAMFLDDRQLNYSGEDYEHILVRAMLSVASLLGDGRDAEAYANSVLEKQLDIMESFVDEGGNKPKQAYKLVAFGAYLRAVVAEESPLKADVAQREFKRVHELEPRFPYGATDLERATSGRHSEKGNGVVHVLALVGRGPHKVEVDEQATAAALAIAQVIWAIYRDQVTFPSISSIKIPALVYYRNNPTGVQVAVDGVASGATATVTDVNLTAKQQFDTMKDYILARAIVRRVFKIVATEATKEAVRSGMRGSRGYEKDLAGLGISILGALWAAAERADTRCWGMLPAKFQALRLEVPAGEHEISLQAMVNGRPVGMPQRVRVLVRDGYNTYVVGLVPTLAGGPPPLTSEPIDTSVVNELN